MSPPQKSGISCVKETHPQLSDWNVGIFGRDYSAYYSSLFSLVRNSIFYFVVLWKAICLTFPDLRDMYVFYFHTDIFKDI